MLTIVVPYYNREQFLPRTLNSIAESGYRPIHLILVNNHSTDRSLQICEEFAENHRSDDFSILLADEPEGGAAKARNRGLDLCTTPFVYFFDSDDLFDKDFLPEIMPQLNESVDVIAVPTKVSVGGKPPVTRVFRQTASPAAQILTGHLSTQAMVFRTGFLRQIGGWNESLPMWNDWELGVRVLDAEPRMKWHTKRSFHTVFLHPDSLTGSSFSQRIDSMRKAVKAVNDETQGRYAKPLFFRMEFITGNLLKEKNRDEASENKKLTRQWFTGRSVITNIFGWLIRRYVAWGGRGSWRLALWLCE